MRNTSVTLIILKDITIKCIIKRSNMILASMVAMSSRNYDWGSHGVGSNPMVGLKSIAHAALILMDVIWQTLLTSEGPKGI